CAYNENIDIIGYNYYGEKPDKLIEKKRDKNGKNNLDVEYDLSSTGDNDEISVYKTFFNINQKLHKPIILSEAGHGNSGPLNIQCFGSTGNTIDVMTNGFTGIAGMHPWEGYQYNYNNQYDERLLWPATIAAEKHMNSEGVLRVLNDW